MTKQEDLSTLFSIPFPKQEEYEITYLDIVSIQTKENAISKIYAHYLDFNSSPKIAEWFISSLLELIVIKSYKKINLENYKVNLEYVTHDSSGRIDIVIDSPETESAILIENKVFHWLHNDLENYWDTFSHYTEKNRIGIILGLTQIPSKNPNFISISHLEWISKMESLIDFSILTERERIYLEDFIINIKYITNETVMNDSIKFYLDHSSKIEQVIAFKEEAFRFVNLAINAVVANYDWDIYGSSNRYKQLWDKQHDVRVFYTLFPDEILQKRELKIVIEIDGRAREYYDKLIQEIQATNLFNNVLQRSDFKVKNSAHLGFQVIPLSDADFDDLAGLIVKKIEELEPKRNAIYEMLVRLGYEDKIKC